VFVVDTNILVYAAETESPEHAPCSRLVEGWRRQQLPWFTSWSILYEFLRVTTHPRVFRRPWALGKAWGFVDALLASPGLSILAPTSRHAEVAAMTFEEVPGLRGNLLFDSHIAILMREHGIRQIYTRDQDFHRFPFLEVVDPLTVTA
jgi:uncharacterized protein